MRLKRTKQCKACPWRKDVNPHDIPNGYSVEKHKNLKRTISAPGDLSGIGCPTINIMACHETHDAHCIGWLVNQIGPGNNIALRLQMMHCENAKDIRTVGEQHERFEDTLPKDDHTMECRTCGERFDMRDLDAVFFHEDHTDRPDIQYKGSKKS